MIAFIMRNSNKKSILIFIILLSVPVIFLSGKFFLIQKLSEERTLIYESECSEIIPLAQTRKESFQQSVKALTDNDIEQYHQETDSYFKSNKSYIDSQSKWIQLSRNLIDRWDYQLLMPQQIKATDMVLVIARTSELQAYIALNEAYKTDNKVSQEKLAKESMHQALISTEAWKQYKSLVNNPDSKSNSSFKKYPCESGSGDILKEKNNLFKELPSSSI